MKIGEEVILPIKWKICMISRLASGAQPGPITSITLSYKDRLFLCANSPDKVELLRHLLTAAPSVSK